MRTGPSKPPTPPAKIANPAPKPAAARRDPAFVDPDAVTERHIFLDSDKRP